MSKRLFKIFDKCPNFVQNTQKKLAFSVKFAIRAQMLLNCPFFLLPPEDVPQP